MSPTKTGRTTIPAAIRAAVLAAGDCYYCAAPWPSEVDHILARALGGTDRPDNLVPACRRCNGEKSDMTTDQWREWRLDRGRPWPPPNLAEAPSTMRTAFAAVFDDDEEIDLYSEAMGRASRAEDAVWRAAIGAHLDRLWIGREDDPETELRRLADALEHADARIAEDRRRCLDRIAAVAARLSVGGDAMTVRRNLAWSVADLAERLFSTTERAALAALVDEFTSREIAA